MTLFYAHANGTSNNFGSFVNPEFPIFENVVCNDYFGVNSNIFKVSQEDFIQIIISNKDAGEHPFHLHGFRFWIMETGVNISKMSNQFSNYGTYRDIVTVPACQPNENEDCPTPETFGYAVIRFVADNPGIWLFHCHIDWHFAAGLGMIFYVEPEIVKQMKLPPKVHELCKSQPFINWFSNILNCIENEIIKWWIFIKNFFVFSYSIS